MSRSVYPFFVLLAVSPILLGSCGLIPNLGCDIKMTDDFIESTCGLNNGVRFEQLEVDTFYEDNSPKIFKVIISFEGHLKDSIYKKAIDRIYFNRPTGMYLWRTDTSSNGLYHESRIRRVRIDKKATDTLDRVPAVTIITNHGSIKERMQESKRRMQEYQAKLEKTCPVKFKPNTWYYISFYDPRYAAYLYVDQDLNYRVDKISLATNF